ncbi:MAG: FAD-dependent oxidoreductase, partial [Oricola sp.]
MPSCDVLIIGGGTNGLACAARLAQSGRKVTVLEATTTPGGGAQTVEFAPGYRVSGLAHIVNMLDARVAAKMDLSRHGLEWASTALSSTALDADGSHLVLEGAAGQTVRGNLSPEDAVAWQALRERLFAFSGALAPFREMAPPRISRNGGNEYLKQARLGMGLRGLGRDRFREFLRVILINVADVLEDDLTDDRLMGLLAFDTVLGAWLGPRSPNSLILLLNRLAGEAAGMRGALVLPRGGMGAVAAAMERAVAAAGGTVLT